jgi:hypothetical protein
MVEKQIVFMQTSKSQSKNEARSFWSVFGLMTIILAPIWRWSWEVPLNSISLSQLHDVCTTFAVAHQGMETAEWAITLTLLDEPEIVS